MKRTLYLIVILCAQTILYAEEPVIFWASDPVKPNQTIAVQGHLLDGNTKLQIAMLKNSKVKRKPEIIDVDFNKIKSIHLDSLQPSLQTGKYVVPENWKLGIYAIRPVNGEEAGKTTLVNAPDSWWIQGDNVDFAVPNGEFGIYGKCLSYNDSAQVYLKDSNGKFQKLEVSAQDLWCVQAKLEKTLSGKYEVFIHNGLGGKYGWVNAGKLVVKEKKAWPQKVFNVVDYGAKPNFNPNRSRLDKTNDAPAIQKALDAAGANGGGIVFLPKGCYQLAGTLTIPKYVTLQGEAENSTNLGWMDNDNPPVGLINASSDFAIKDMTIFVKNHYSVIRSNHGHHKNSGNITLHNLTIRASRYIGLTPRDRNDWEEEFTERMWNVSPREAPLMLGGENISLRNVDVLGSHNSIILDKASGEVVDCKFHCPQTYKNSQYWIRGCNNLVFENNDIYGGGCLGTHHTSRGQYRKKDWEIHFNTYSRNIYFAGNKQHDNWKWDREMMCLDSHGYDGPYLGPVKEGKGAKVVLPDPFPALRIGGEISSKTGSTFSNKKLKNGEYYKVIVRLESKEAKLDWDRYFANFYDADEPLEATEPEIYTRTGDSRHYAHGKVKSVRIRGSKGFEIKELRVAKSWEDIADPGKGEVLFKDAVLNGDEPKKNTALLFDFDADGKLYLCAIIRAKGAYCTGQAELLLENGKRALDIGIGRISIPEINFNNRPTSPYKIHANNINLYESGAVFVLEGKGCGQYRIITGGKDKTLNLDRPWDVELDETSVISVHRIHDHQLFVDNTFTDGGNSLQGGPIEAIFANNTAIRAGGFSVNGLHGCASMYSQFIGNKIVNGAGYGCPPFNFRGGKIIVEPYRPSGYLNGFQTIGVIMRENELSNLASLMVCGPVQNVLIENNNISNTEAGVIVNSEGMGAFECSWMWPEDVMIRSNELDNVETPVKADEEANVVVIE